MMDEQNEVDIFLAGFFILAAALLLYTMIGLWQVAEAQKSWPDAKWPIGKIKPENKGE